MARARRRRACAPSAPAARPSPRAEAAARAAGGRRRTGSRPAPRRRRRRSGRGREAGGPPPRSRRRSSARSGRGRDGADRRLDPDPRQLVLEHERLAVASGRDELAPTWSCRRDRTCRGRRRPARPRRRAARRSRSRSIRSPASAERLRPRAAEAVELVRASPSTTRRRRNGSVFTSAPPTPSASRSTKSSVRSSCS